MAGREYPLGRTRNIGIMAHVDTSKTATTECILYYIGISYKIDNTHEGTTTMDWVAQEQRRGITITSAATTCHWTLRENRKPKPDALEHRINITGALRHVDFTAGVERSLRVLDGVVGVFCVKGSVEPQSENIWHQTDTYNIPRITFVNKMDALGTNFYGVVDQIKTKLDRNVICTQLPIGKGDDFKRITDLLEMKAYIYNDDKGDDISIVDIPEDMQDDTGLYRSELIERACEPNNDLVIIYLEGEEPNNDNLKKALRKAACECVAIPVCCGIAYRSKGAQKLLDTVIKFMPPPLDIPSIKDADLDSNEVECHPPDDEPLTALAFKIVIDPSVGKLVFFHVYSGSLNSSSHVLGATKDKKERVRCILQMYANRRNEPDRAYSGDIAATAGFKVISTDGTIYDEKNPVILESMEFPEPVTDVAIEPKTKADQGKMGGALAKLAEENSTFHVRTDEEANQTIISDMGELHLDIIVGYLLREFNVETSAGTLQAAYKETFIKAANVDNKYAKQSGGRGQYGHCKAHFTPMEANTEEIFKFTSSITGGTIPKKYIPVVGEGIGEVCKADILGGFPVLGVHASVYDGFYHEVDFSKMVFHIAGSMAFREAIHRSNPILLKPITKVEVTMLEDHVSDVISDINSRRGRIEGMEDIGGGKIVRAYVPSSEMFGYSTGLRSRTQGCGNYSMFLDKYELVPKNIQEKVPSDRKK